MNHLTSIGLDVHARSIAAAAFNPLTGEVTTKTFGYDPAGIAQWAASFEAPKAVYESGVTGFHLCRELGALGLECVVAATSKIQRPPADAKQKNDLNDAAFLARLLARNNIMRGRSARWRRVRPSSASTIRCGGTRSQAMRCCLPAGP